ncbi:MAG: hypothetical protein GQ532_14710 [Methylomarinum sp.]|nr:hypothetical protein [Methylomarinum sp.]
MNVFNLKVVILFTALFGFNSAAVLADEELESSVDTEVSTESEISGDFTSRDRLIETLVVSDEDAKAELEKTQKTLAETEAERDAAQAELDTVATDATAEEIAALEKQLADAEKEVDIAGAEVAKADAGLAEVQAAQETQLELVAELSDEQVFALNRTLNNAVNNDLIGELDGALILQTVVDGDYNKLQINSFTKALEEEAKFTAFADKFQDKYEASGNEKFLEISDRMLSRGEIQKDKFLAKVDRFADKGSFSKDAAKNQVKELAKLSAKGEAKAIAKKAALSSAKKAAKTQAKLNAKNISKQIIKEEGRKSLKENGRRDNSGSKGKKSRG